MWPDRRTFIISALIVVAAVAGSVGLYVTDDDNPPTATSEGSESSSDRTTTTRPGKSTTASTTTTGPERSTTTATTVPAPPTVPGEQPLVVTEQGYSVFPSGYGEFTTGSYGAVVSNPSANVAAIDIDIDVTFTDAGGAIVGVQPEVIELLLPGQSSAVGGPMNDLGPEATTMQVDIISVTYEPVAAAPGTITIDGVNLVRDEEGFVTMTGGVVHSSFGIEAPFVTVVALYRDSANRIVGADVGFVNNPIPPGGSEPFEVPGFDQVPNVVSATPVASLPLELLGN